MTADQRLDQLEPLLSEAMTVLDRHTVQLRQLSERLVQLVGLVIKQSDNISFLLSENIIIKERLTKVEADIADLKQGQVELRQGQAELLQGQTTLQQGQADLQNGQTTLQQGQVDINRKLDLLITKLS